MYSLYQVTCCSSSKQVEPMPMNVGGEVNMLTQTKRCQQICKVVVWFDGLSKCTISLLFTLFRNCNVRCSAPKNRRFAVRSTRFLTHVHPFGYTTVIPTFIIVIYTYFWLITKKQQNWSILWKLTWWYLLKAPFALSEKKDVHCVYIFSFIYFFYQAETCGYTHLPPPYPRHKNPLNSELLVKGRHGGFKCNAGPERMRKWC